MNRSRSGPCGRSLGRIWVSRKRPGTPIVRAASPIRLDEAARVAGRRVLVIEDAPTITHGEMAYGAGYVAALTAGAAEIVDPRRSAAPEIAGLFDAYPHIGKVLPAVGSSAAQVAALESTINDAAADLVVSATTVDLAHLLRANKPILRARYDFAEVGEPTLSAIVEAFIDHGSSAGRASDSCQKGLAEPA